MASMMVASMPANNSPSAAWRTRGKPHTRKQVPSTIVHHGARHKHADPNTTSHICTVVMCGCGRGKSMHTTALPGRQPGHVCFEPKINKEHIAARTPARTVRCFEGDRAAVVCHKPLAHAYPAPASARVLHVHHAAQHFDLQA